MTSLRLGLRLCVFLLFLVLTFLFFLGQHLRRRSSFILQARVLSTQLSATDSRPSVYGFAFCSAYAVKVHLWQVVAGCGQRCDQQEVPLMTSWSQHCGDDLPSVDFHCIRLQSIGPR